MRPISLIAVLVLSFLMPLQVVAEALLFASPCPVKLQYSAAQLDPDSADPELEMAAMPCCPEAQNRTLKETTKLNAEWLTTDFSDKNTNSQCNNLSSCHLCKVPVQLNFSSAKLMASIAVVSHFVNSSSQVSGLFNPASIWRPPSNS